MVQKSYPKALKGIVISAQLYDLPTPKSGSDGTFGAAGAQTFFISMVLRSFLQSCPDDFWKVRKSASIFLIFGHL